MKKYKLIVDSSCDIPIDFYSSLDVSVTDLIINFNERQFVDRKDITSKEILKIYDETKIFPKTSALNIPELESCFESNLKEAEHLFYLPISSKISSINNNAHLAARDLGVEDKVTVLDSASLSSGIALEVIGIADDIKAALPVETIVKNHEERVKKISMSFVIDTMEFLHKGGRCSGLTYIIGNKLHIHPIIKLNDGKMGVHTLVRGKDISKGVQKIVDEFIEQFEADNIDFSYPIFIPHVEGDYGVKKVEKDLKDLVGKNILYPIEASGIICCHCGRDTVGLAYMLKRPIEK